MRGTKFIIAVIIVVFACMTPPVTIGEQANTVGNNNDQITTDNPKADIDEEALSILKKATDYLTGLKHFTLKVVDTKDVVQASGQKIQFASTIEVAIRRPNQLFGSWARDDGSIRQLWYNGKTVTIYEDTENAYGQVQVPDTIDKMFDYIETVLKSSQPLADLLDNDLSHLAELPLSGSYIGVAYLDGIACDHLAFRGEKPLIQKMVITYRQIAGEPQYTARLIACDIQPNISDDLFHFSPPEGARQIRVLVSEREKRRKGGTQ